MSRLGHVVALLAAAGSYGAMGYAKPSTYVVKIKSSADFEQSLANFKQDPRFEVVDSHKEGNLIEIRAVGQSKTGIAKSLGDVYKSSDVSYVVSNVTFHAFETINDPKFNEQWALGKVNATSAWDMTTGSKDVVVAVIDTGVDWKHEDLQAQMWRNTKEIEGNGKDDDNNGFIDDVRGWDFRDNDNDPMDETSQQNPGHGTHCAGIVGAAGNNAKGISGLARKVTLMPIRFLGADGSGDLLNGAKAIDYAVNNGAQVISASWGAKVPRSQVEPIIEALERARQKGVVFIAAAANSGENNDVAEYYPTNAGLDNVISVSASNNTDGKPQWSNYGRGKVSLASPGENILSTIPGNNYRELSGTSMATPLVAGMAALMVAKATEDGTSLSPLEMRSILQATGQNVEIETACQCRIDAQKALEHLEARNLTVVPAAFTLNQGETRQFTAFGGTEPYQFASSDTSVASVDTNGLVTAAAQGSTVLTVTDASGKAVQSRPIFVGYTQGGGGGACPLGDPMICQLLCLIEPTLPWCEQL